MFFFVLIIFDSACVLYPESTCKKKPKQHSLQKQNKSLITSLRQLLLKETDLMLGAEPMPGVIQEI